MNFKQNEEAVSPVIGTILMVAITVILAAVIAAFVFGMTDNLSPQKDVAVTAIQSTNADGDAILTVTIQGGSDVSLLSKVEYLLAEATTGTELIATPGLGVSGTVPLTAGQNNHVVIRGIFQDGTQQVLLDGNYYVAT